MTQTHHIEKLLAGLESIAAANYKKWSIPHATAEDFVTWAQSRAKFVINEVKATLDNEQYITTNRPVAIVNDCEPDVRPSPSLIEQPLITAEEARKLGAGNAEWFGTFSSWIACSEAFQYPTWSGTSKIKYRAIKP